MITLAIAELVHALAPHLKGMFGGEAGVSTMRMPAWGLDFGSTTQVYYLTLAWVLLAMALLYLYTRTPLGRLTLGLRENSHRLGFLALTTSMDYQHPGVRRLRDVFRRGGQPAGAVQRVGQLRGLRPGPVGRRGPQYLYRRCPGLPGPALGAALMTFFGYAAVGPDPLVAACYRASCSYWS